MSSHRDSTSNRRQVQFGEGEYPSVTADQSPMATDRRLLLAALDHESIANMAEPTILEGFERRRPSEAERLQSLPTEFSEPVGQSRPNLSAITARWKSHARNVSAPSGGLNPSGEKARLIALKLKTMAASNVKVSSSTSGGDLNGLWKKIKAQRANKDQSLGSEGSGREGTSESVTGSHRAVTAISHGSEMDRWFKVAEHVRGLGSTAKGAGEDDGMATPGSEEAEETGGADEQTPLIQPTSLDSPQPRNSRFRSMIQPSPGSLLYGIIPWWTELRKQLKTLAIAFNATLVKERLVSFLKNGVFMVIAPALAVSAFFYYQLNNPGLSALPTDASISYWILFGIRHYLTLQLAFVAQYLFIDVMSMNTLLSVELFGSLATLNIINSEGAPFILTAWGLLNLLLIQGNYESNVHGFFSHWLYFTDWEMFSEENSSDGVNESDIYTRILVSMVVAGLANSLKRTFLSVYLGRRIYTHHESQLEKVMLSIIHLGEVASLGGAINDRVSTLHAVKRFSAEKSELSSDGEIVEEGSKRTLESTPWNLLHSERDLSDKPTDQVGKISSHKILEKANIEAGDDKVCAEQYIEDATAPQRPSGQEVSLGEDSPADNPEPAISSAQEPQTAATTSHILALLDEWDEPVNKQDKAVDPKISEILRFKQALSLLEDSQPFGPSFGPAFSRDSCIKSSNALYKRLLQLSPGSSVLHFDVIGALAYNVDGTVDYKKAKNLVRLFRPDRFDEISLLNFVQSCDAAYKQLRNLRAAVGNSIKIDKVLESIFVGVFHFVLALVVMSILRLNPWTLLVSLSTVLVSFAFAFGPSVAKIIEGMIMIAARRPFDLGDRISISGTNAAPDDTFIVEDCTLYTTTLRNSRTNEICTVNNGSIANSLIVNHGRSHNALVNIALPMKIDATYDQVQIVLGELEQYIQEHPRVWKSLISFRITKVDPSNGLIAYSARLQHVKSWQDLLPVSKARGEVDSFCAEILMKLGIEHDGDVVNNKVLVKELPEQQIFPKIVSDAGRKVEESPPPTPKSQISSRLGSPDSCHGQSAMSGRIMTLSPGEEE